MKNLLKQFEVEILHLGTKELVLEFNLDQGFFGAFEQDLVSKGNLNAKVSLLKTSSMIKADFDIIGEIELICDRSLKEFNFPIDTIQTVYYKFGDRDEEISEDVMIIKSDAAVLNVAQQVFDIIGVEIPIKKIHPDLITEKDSEEGDILIYSSVTNENELTDNDIDILDPRWEALKKLKDAF